MEYMEKHTKNNYPTNDDEFDELCKTNQLILQGKLTTKYYVKTEYFADLHIIIDKLPRNECVITIYRQFPWGKTIKYYRWSRDNGLEKENPNWKYKEDISKMWRDFLLLQIMIIIIAVLFWFILRNPLGWIDGLL